MLTIALAKGRLAEKAMAIFSRIGLDCREMHEKSRKLLFVNERAGVQFFLAKPGDVPTYVEYGAADLGVAGKDTLLEESRSLYELFDFGFGACKLSVAGLSDTGQPDTGQPDTGQPGTGQPESLLTRNGLRVATKYSKVAARYFDSLGVNIELIKLSGSIELAPIIGLADVIVDIVETGATLDENGLTVLADICPISARLIANRVSMKLENERISEIVTQLKAFA